MEELKNRSPRSYFEAISRMEERGIDGLIVTAPDTIVMREEIDRLVAVGIPVVTCDSDVYQSRRLYHVGQDMVKSGRVAAYRRPPPSTDSRTSCGRRPRRRNRPR